MIVSMDYFPVLPITELARIAVFLKSESVCGHLDAWADLWFSNFLINLKCPLCCNE